MKRISTFMFIAVIFMAISISCDDSDNTDSVGGEKEPVYSPQGVSLPLQELPEDVSGLINLVMELPYLSEKWCPQEVYRLTDLQTSEVFYYLNMGPDLIWNMIIGTEILEDSDYPLILWYVSDDLYKNYYYDKEISLSDPVYQKELYWVSGDRARTVDFALNTELKFRPSDVVYGELDGSRFYLRLFWSRGLDGHFGIITDGIERSSTFSGSEYLFGYRIRVIDTIINEDEAEAERGNDYAVMMIEPDEEERALRTDGISFRIKEDETLSANGLSITCLDISDSRYPLAAYNVCIDGSFDLYIKVGLATDEGECSKVLLEPYSSDGVEFGGYRINLLSANPYPSWDLRGYTDSFAWLKVTPLEDE